MTTFYSTKRSSNVTIPNSRVCGYKIQNYNTKKGWQSGVRAGRNNGVVDQRLSRFATDCDAKELECKVAGNTNWLNHRMGTDFQKIKGGTPFNIDRRSFQAGSTFVQKGSADSIAGINQRRGLGNRDITRHNFTAPAIMARQTDNFGKLQVTELANFKNSVELGEKTLARLFDVDIPDPTDTKWLNEKNRLTALLTARGLSADEIKIELEVNKPLGRSQRTNKGKRNIGASNLSINNKIAELAQEVKDGRAENRVGVAGVSAQLIQALADTAALSNLTQAGIRDLELVIGRINVPKAWDAFFPAGTGQIVGNDWLVRNSGEFNLFLLSNLRTNRMLTPKAPAFNLIPNQNPPISLIIQLNSLYTSTRRALNSLTRRFVDLSRRSLISAEVAKTLINNGATTELSVAEAAYIQGKNAFVAKPIPHPERNESLISFVTL